MLNWLVRRLTPYKASVDRWLSLASSIQQAWEETFDPAISRVERLRSYYQADYQDLSRLIREMGDYFAEDLPDDNDRPIAVSWRRLELEYKDLELILSSVFRRHFGNLPVTWFPVFAPLSEPYGVGFKVAEGPWPELKNIPPNGMFLTSRGRLGVDHGHLLQMGLKKAQFLEKGLPLLQRTKPLHIVYDGPLWYIYFDLPTAFDLSVPAWDREGCFTLLFAPVGGRFDITPADVMPLDRSTLICRWEREDQRVFPLLPFEQQIWHLDDFMPEGFPHDWLPLDCALHGVETQLAYPFGFVLGEPRRSYGLPVAAAEFGKMSVENESRGALSFTNNPGLSCILEAEVSATMTFLPNDWQKSHLDWFVPEGFPGDWLPLDALLMGCEKQLFNALRLYTGACEQHSNFSMVCVEAVMQSVSETACPVVAEKFSIESFPRDVETPYPIDFYNTNGCDAALYCSQHTRENTSVLLADIGVSHSGSDRVSPPRDTPFFCSPLLSEEKQRHAYMRHSNLARLDTYPRFDLIPADFAPLDIVAGGFYA